MTAAFARIVAAAFWAVSVWTLWAWWANRLADAPGADVAAWAAFAAFAVVLWRRAGRAAVARRIPLWKLLSAAALLFVFHAVRGAVAPTASGVIAVLAGVPLLLPEEGDGGGSLPPLPMVALALLGLPTAMIADLVLGFPLRLVAVRASAWLLSSAGWDVAAEGSGLSVGGVAVWVDAPCAGVRMLGAGLVLAFSLAQAFRLRAARSAALAVAAVAAVVVANVARVSVLVVFEAVGVHLSSAAHMAAGCLAMLLGAACCAFAALRLGRGRGTA